MRTPLITLVGLAFVGAAALQPAPASAAEDGRCSTLPQQVRSALVGADSGAAQSATRRLRTGERLCKAGNERAAAREFATALKLLGAEGRPTYAAGK